MAATRKLVVKIGSSTLTDDGNRIDRAYLTNVAAQLARLRHAGWQPIVVTSAAIASGLEVLGFDRRPADIPSLQAAASVGQCALSSAYAQAFAHEGMTTSLVLLTRRDTADREAYLHARDTFGKLLEFGVVPIVNENDTVSVEQIRFGDNDTLAALVACLVEAQLVVILSDIDGLYTGNPAEDPDARLMHRVPHIDADILSCAGGAGSAAGSGGMQTKVKAARVLSAAGIPLVVCNGRAPEAITRAVDAPDAPEGEGIGTVFLPAKRPHEISPRKLWIALGDSARGSLIIDDGAKAALLERGSSLLAVGIAAVEGTFASGDIVDVKDLDGLVVARGRAAFSSDEVVLGRGRTSAQLRANRLLAELAEKPIVHRDELMLFE